VRAAEALALVIPFFLVLFASTYFLMEGARRRASPAADPDGCLVLRGDRVLGCGGFGDITARSETARVVLIVTMLAYLALLGTGIRVLLGL
jgi:voltage-gated potassium channel